MEKQVMKTDVVINRMKDILNVCDSNEHCFIVVNGKCTDCSQCPEFTYEGETASVENVRLKEDTIEVCIKTFEGNAWKNIDWLSTDDIVNILRTIETQRNLEEFQVNRKSLFQITLLSRDDISAMGFKNVETISDSTMERIASKMAEHYISELFWDDLDCLVSMYCPNLEREENDEDC